jgi:predicted extracellular nuclease
VLSSTAASTITVRAVDDTVFEDVHAGSITHAITQTADAAGYPTSFAVGGLAVTIADNDAPQTPTRISLLQGSGASSPRLNETVAVSAVVTGFLLGSSGTRDGFFLQEEDAEADADPATSEGLFVYTAQSPALAATVAGLGLGDVVTAVGKVIEFGGLTELTTEGVGVASLTRTATGAVLPTPATLRFPAASATAFERYEGMRVTVPEPLTVTDNESLGQFGELLLSSGGLLIGPTSVIDPNDEPATGTTSTGATNVPAINARVAADALRTLLLDDGSTRSYPVPTPHLTGTDPATATRRAGDTVTGLSGVLSYGFGTYRVQPVAPVPFVDGEPPYRRAALSRRDGQGGEFQCAQLLHHLWRHERPRGEQRHRIRPAAGEDRGGAAGPRCGHRRPDRNPEPGRCRGGDQRDRGQRPRRRAQHRDRHRRHLRCPAASLRARARTTSAMPSSTNRPG